MYALLSIVIQGNYMSSTATKPTTIPFAPIRQKLREAIEKYKAYHPERTDEHQELQKLFDAIKSEKTFDTKNIDKPLYEHYPGYVGKYEDLTLFQLATVLDSEELAQSIKPTKIPFEPIKKKLIEAIEKYKKNHPEKTGEHQELQKLVDAIKYEKTLDIKNIDKPLYAHYPEYVGEYQYSKWLALAVFLDSAKLVHSILEHGARPYTESDPLPYALFDDAVRAGNPEIVRLLINAGADVDASNDFGSTPLLRAVEVVNLEIVELLLNAGADVDASDDFKSAPLLYAANHGHTDIVAMLLRYGANANIKDSVGNTPLHLCAYYGDIHMAKMLVQYGVDINAKNRFGSKAIETARHEIAEYLLNLSPEKVEQEGTGEGGQSSSSDAPLQGGESNAEGFIGRCKQWWSQPTVEEETDGIIPFDTQRSGVNNPKEVEQVDMSGKVDQEDSDN